MGFELVQAASPQDLVDVLNGTLHAPRPLDVSRSVDESATKAETFLNLNGKTLVFTTPAVTVTFATPDPMTPQDMLAELVAQVQAADPLFRAQIINAQVSPQTLPPRTRLKMWTTAPGGLALNLAGSPAAALLGLDTAGTLVGAPKSTTVVHGGDTITGGIYVVLST